MLFGQFGFRRASVWTFAGLYEMRRAKRFLAYRADRTRAQNLHDFQYSACCSIRYDDLSLGNIWDALWPTQARGGGRREVYNWSCVSSALTRALAILLFRTQSDLRAKIETLRFAATCRPAGNNTPAAEAPQRRPNSIRPDRCIPLVFSLSLSLSRPPLSVCSSAPHTN